MTTSTSTITALLVAAAATVALASPAAAASGSGAVTATTAHSSVGGPVKRSEVIERAKFWFGKGHVYGHAGGYPDPQGRHYRADCSGYVSMAWHLASDPNTEGLPGLSKKIAKGKVDEGDAIGHMGPGTGGPNGHVRIFEKWANSAHSQYWAYDFGSTPVKHRIYSWGQPNYAAYRYDKILAG